MPFHIKLLLAMSILAGMAILMWGAIDVLRRRESTSFPTAPVAACLLSGMLMPDAPLAFWHLGLQSCWIYCASFAVCTLLGVLSLIWLRRITVESKHKPPIAKLILK